MVSPSKTICVDVDVGVGVGVGVDVGVDVDVDVGVGVGVDVGVDVGVERVVYVSVDAFGVAVELMTIKPLASFCGGVNVRTTATNEPITKVRIALQ